ncbi:N-acetylmuramoyl-L-alanine amidase [Actinomyces sp. B33]|uniref:N-acetylmuramoyl-L-alanine amidase family protein n=1 Tax=Actinomyces sp. B33 TaxID=2942131 RepID=UPI0023417075|nr:N-acetylmuramoyl-L-alanine amidase [Actinomyces sp. B33]MDC4232656.1 N-acetylmuramoyl-L-alanine amidase [Actinomyces sp. B33]
MPLATTSALALAALLALSPLTGTASPSPTPRAGDDGASPVQIVELTTPEGDPTPAATAALEEDSPVGASDSFDPARGAAVLTLPIEVEEFLVAGLTWTGGPEVAASMLIRVERDGLWSNWFAIEAESSPVADGSVRNGTEPFITGGARAVQVRIGDEGSGLPEDLRLALVPADPDGEEEVLPSASLSAVDAPSTGLAPDAADDPGAPDPAPSVALEPNGTGVGASVASPSRLAALVPATTTANDLPVGVTSRAQWGADESLMTWDPEYYPTAHVVIHHTAGTNDYTMDQSASVVRGVYEYHAKTLGWGDIGYNFLVDKWGRAFEGRSGSATAPAGQMVEAGHARGYNRGTMGISMLGTYTSSAPSDATIRTVGRLAGWQLGRAGATNASGSGLYAHKGATLARIVGHRDVNATACPGDAAYARMADFRHYAQETIDAAPAHPSAVVQPAQPQAPSPSAPTAQSDAPQTLVSPTPDGAPDLSGSGAWARDAAGWWWRLSDGRYPAAGWSTIDGATYHFDRSGYTSTGWLRLDGSWYRLAPSGALERGWVLVDGFWYLMDDKTGAQLTGWRTSSDGWRHYGADGSRTVGWLLDRGSWYYLDPTTALMRTGALDLASGSYWLSPTGVMATGWVDTDDGWRLHDDTGLRRTGWVKDRGTWYHLNPDTGLMTTGWLEDRGTWYHLNPDTGAMTTGWLEDRGTWYWLDSSGAMATGTRTIDGVAHGFSSTGAWTGRTASSTAFAAGQIISDEKMFTGATMSAAAVQSFLDARNPGCVAAPDGTPCLKDYRTTTSTMTAPHCSAYTGAADESAATIIAKTSAACGVSAEVLLVMLQKEQGLVTASGASLRSGASLSRYDKALGMGCPDSAACSASYRGFAPQVYYAASRLVDYGANPSSYSYAAGGTYSIAYHPNASCGSSRVTISNRATAALYNYTPYQPNAAALANMTGSGDSCSAYGNRNFWRIYRGWFGSTL